MQPEEDNLRVKRIEKEDYPLLNSWYKSWGFPEMAVEGVVSQFGLIVYNGDEPILAAFLYLTDSITAHPEFLVVNKEYRNKEMKKLAFTRLFTEFEDYAKLHNYKNFIMSVKNPFLIKSLEDNGFFKTDINMTNLIKSF